MWATEQEAADRFLAETLAAYAFRVYDEWDNGEFLTGATVDLIERGKVVQTEKFVASSEFPPEGEFSAYGNGRDNHALTQALSYAWSWVESEERRAEAERLGVHPLELALAPYGPEWEREQEARVGAVKSR